MNIGSLSYRLSAGLCASFLLFSPLSAHAGTETHWSKVLQSAQGQTVYWNAWGGEPRINSYIEWVGDQVKENYGISLNHVKLKSTGDAVSKVLAEKSAGKDKDGSVDLIWINGENFASMKENDLLLPSWAEDLPNFPLTDPENNPSVLADFTVPVEGQESPWSSAMLTFYSDTDIVEDNPMSIGELADWAKDNPGRFAYPDADNYLGATFLKQALIVLASDTSPLYYPLEDADFDKVTKPLWAYLDELHPYLWRKGRIFPKDQGELRQLMADGELDMAFAFGDAIVTTAIEDGELPESVETFVFKEGMIGNINFVAIPYNASAPEAAKVVANFLLSPEAQAHKANPEIWGASTVLNVDKLPEAQRQLFTELKPKKGGLPQSAYSHIISEPHPSWMVKLKEEWKKRYSFQ